MIPQRRNPLRLLVTRETQLRVLALVGTAVFFCIAVAVSLAWLLPDKFWAGVLILAFGALASLIVSRQIAGPFYRIEKDLESILTGATKDHPIHLREGDPLGHLADLVNQLIARHR